MLVLRRKESELVRMIDTRTGAVIEITVCAITSSACRIGIEAPLQYKILRQEVTDLSVSADPPAWPLAKAV